MTFIALVPNVYYNVKQYGAVVNGTTDDTAAIAAAITALAAVGGGYVFLPGICGITAPLTLPTKVWLVGAGPGTGLKALSGFSGAEMVLITGADFCGVRDLQLIGGTSTTSSSNPVTKGIYITQSQYTHITDIECWYINGYAIDSTCTSTTSNSGGMFENIHIQHCASGINFLGLAASNNVGQQFLSNIHLQRIDSGDGLHIEDINDIHVVNINGALDVGAGNTTGSMINVVGNCASIYFSNVDVGVTNGTAASDTVTVKNNANGTPNSVVFEGGIIQAGLRGFNASQGTNIVLSGIKISGNQTHGVRTTATVGPLLITHCIFSSNGQTAAASNYEINATSSGLIDIDHCLFTTAQGTGAGQVKAVLHFNTGTCYCRDNSFQGAGFTAALVSDSTIPTIMRGNAGYNPLGFAVAQPAVPASTVNATNTSGVDCMVHISGGTLTVVNVGGSATGITAAAAAGSVHTVRVPAGSTISITYTVAPTWKWFGD